MIRRAVMLAFVANRLGALVTAFRTAALAAGVVVGDRCRNVFIQASAISFRVLE
jgi:hypothetical protein